MPLVIPEAPLSTENAHERAAKSTTWYSGGACLSNGFYRCRLELVRWNWDWQLFQRSMLGPTALGKKFFWVQVSIHQLTIYDQHPRCQSSWSQHVFVSVGCQLIQIRGDGQHNNATQSSLGSAWQQLLALKCVHPSTRKRTIAKEFQICCICQKQNKRHILNIYRNSEDAMSMSRFFVGRRILSALSQELPVSAWRSAGSDD